MSIDYQDVLEQIVRGRAPINRSALVHVYRPEAPRGHISVGELIDASMTCDVMLATLASIISINSSLSLINTALSSISSSLTVINNAIASLQLPNAQAAIKLTNSGGQIDWTYPVPFGNGVVPVIGADVLHTTSQPFAVRIVSIDNIHVVLQILTSAAVSVALIGLTVLTALVSAGINIPVHISARNPS